VNSEARTRRFTTETGLGDDDLQRPREDFTSRSDSRSVEAVSEKLDVAVLRKLRSAAAAHPAMLLSSFEQIHDPAEEIRPERNLLAKNGRFLPAFSVEITRVNSIA